MKIAKIIAVLAAFAGLALSSCAKKEPAYSAPAPVAPVTIGK